MNLQIIIDTLKYAQKQTTLNAPALANTYYVWYLYLKVHGLTGTSLKSMQVFCFLILMNGDDGIIWEVVYIF